MRRRDLMAIVGGAALGYPVVSRAQENKTPVIGWLGTAASNAPGVVRALSAFWQGLGKMGFVEGRNVRFDYRWTEGHNDRLPAVAASLVADKVDVIIAAGSLPQVLAAKAATRTIPIVFVTGADPVKEGLVASARPARRQPDRRRRSADRAERQADGTFVGNGAASQNDCLADQSQLRSCRAPGAVHYRCVFRGKSAADSGMKSATDSDLMSATPI